jgi:hypothetical protein
VASLRPNWLVCFVIAKTTSVFFILTPFLSCVGILLIGLCVSDHQRINFLNVYGPCLERKHFWEKVDGSGLLAKGDLVIVEDLNLTTSAAEVWGATTSLDPLALFFKDLFSRNHLIDIMPVEVTPTWRNGRFGVEEIVKRLDRILVSEDLFTTFDRFRTWVEFPYISDHALILLQLGKGFPTVAHPFKFNHNWLS